jgi:Beta-ketoacyl synthase, N-terminal domain
LQIRLPISRWSAWPPVEAGSREQAAPPELKFVDPMLRRRLGPLAKILLHLANECTAGLPAVRLVLASQHGELSYTLAMLRSLAAEEPVSPTLFSLSVHNAPAGVFSILRGDRTPSSAIAAGEETLGHALLEAYCQLDDNGGEPVLMVYGDAPLPGEYRPYAERTEPRRAIAVLLAPGASRTMTLEAAAPQGASVSPEPQADAFFRHLAEGRPTGWTSAQRAWSWH